MESSSRAPSACQPHSTAAVRQLPAVVTSSASHGRDARAIGFLAPVNARRRAQARGKSAIRRRAASRTVYRPSAGRNSVLHLLHRRPSSSKPATAASPRLLHQPTHFWCVRSPHFFGCSAAIPTLPSPTLGWVQGAVLPRGFPLIQPIRLLVSAACTTSPVTRAAAADAGRQSSGHAPRVLVPTASEARRRPPGVRATSIFSWSDDTTRPDADNNEMMGPQVNSEPMNSGGPIKCHGATTDCLVGEDDHYYARR
jgi:hypothetical protein